ncbi:MAG: DUF2262 domain-containing protein [Saprospiraceae bacterium]|nr:DUF2262 domain-containing protein [Saprospiraceae bacterium]
MKNELDGHNPSKGIKIEGVGHFDFDEEMQNFKTVINWIDNSIEIILDVASEAEITDHKTTLLVLLSSPSKFHKKVMDFGINTILKLKNDFYLEQEEQPMNEETFRNNSKLESIRIFRKGGFEFGFNKVLDIFNGGYYLINGTIENGPEDYDIGF